MRRLNGMDASFVYGETPSWHMHGGSLFILDPTTAAGGFDVHRLRALIEARSGLLGPLLARLVKVPLGLDRPVWVNDPRLDLERQIRCIGVPRPGGPRELSTLVGDLFAFELDRSRPLWEAWLIEGLEGGRVGLLLKVHHSLVDGVHATRLYEVLFDLDPGAPLDRPGTPSVAAEPVPSQWEMALRALPRLATTPLRVARTARRLGGAGLRMARFRVSPQWSAATFPFQAPQTSLNKTITSHRDFAFCSLPLAEVKDIKNAFSVTVNDVVLGICAGALRDYLAERAELPGKPLIAQIPVAVHGDDLSAWGNAVTVMGASLPTQLADPAERLRAIHDSTQSAKAMRRALGDDVVLDLADVVPPGVVAAGVRAYSRLRLSERHPPVFNLIVSNVPGPSFPLFLAGAELVANYVLGPMFDGGGLNITVISYRDHVDFGFVVCPEVVDDPWLLADAASRALVELEAAARATRRPRAGVSTTRA